MTPECISEQLMYNTVRLETITNNHSIEQGTGFFFNFKIGNLTILTLITNKHVVNYNQDPTINFFLHSTDKSGEGADDVILNVTYTTHWYFHPTQDLCFTFVNPLFEYVRKRFGKQVFCTTIEENLICDKGQLRELTAMEEIVMIGYPNGLWDESHNYPIFRRGVTACHPGYDICNEDIRQQIASQPGNHSNIESIGLIDAGCFPGSSGSPIYILDNLGYMDKHGNIAVGNNRVIFLGVLFAGPRYPLEVNICNGDIADAKKIVPLSMMHLGYYIKSYEILEFKNIIQQILNK